MQKKQEILERYKFCLCFENTSFPGYITEKIFDCFFSGAIPIYWGAPDIDGYVPPEAFIDARLFPTFFELESYLRDLSPDEGAVLVHAGADFVASDAFKKFSDERFADVMLGLIAHSARDR